MKWTKDEEAEVIAFQLDLLMRRMNIGPTPAFRGLIEQFKERPHNEGKGDEELPPVVWGRLDGRN